MTAPAYLDQDTAAWLARLDPTLAKSFAVTPTPTPPPGTVSITPHDVCWTPGVDCSLAYRLTTDAGSTEFLAVAGNQVGWQSHDFRDDPCLPGLRAAMEPAVVAELLTSVVGGSVSGVTIDPVRYRPRSRCVLRYEVVTTAGRSVFYAKVLEERSFQALTRVVRALAQTEGSERLGAPLVAVWPHLAAVVTAGAQGVSGGELLADTTRPLSARVRLAHRIGHVLGEMHALQGVSVPQWTPADQVTSLRGSMVPAAVIDAELADQMSRLVDQLEAHLPTAVDDVLSHGGFRAGQVVVGEASNLAVLDLDGCRLSDRALDLGTALAQLSWRSVRRPGERAVLPHLEDALLAGYRARAGNVELENLSWWRAVALLQVAARRYRRLETKDWPSVPLLIASARRQVEDWETRSTRVTDLDLLDVRRMATVLAPLLAPEYGGEGSVSIGSARQLAVAEGRRMVVRYSIHSRIGETESAVIGKSFTDLARANLLDLHLRLLSDGPFSLDGFRVPEPLGVVEAHRLAVLGLVDGEPLNEITDAAAVESGVRGAALWLARLHTSDVALPRVLCLDREGHSVHEWAAAIAQVYPDLGVRAAGLATGWERRARAAESGRLVPLHKDFHAGHVFVGDNISVIDLDEARMGDAALDVAHFCAYLEVMHDEVTAAALRTVFLETYAAAAWFRPHSFAPWCAYSWLKIAKQRARGRGPLPAANLTGRRSDVELALNRGFEWLRR